MLRPCKECGAEISSRAYTCPRCGYPLWAERLLKVLGPLMAVVCWTCGGLIYWNVEYGAGRDLNGPGPLVEPFQYIRRVAIGIIIAGFVLLAVGHLIWRSVARQRTWAGRRSA